MCRFSQVGVNNKENCGMYLSSAVDAAAFKVLLVVFEKDIQTQQVCNIFKSSFPPMGLKVEVILLVVMKIC